ncbi:ABC transporter ATP-binding protein [Desulfosporosinus sp.]|uniref:ABC transporter ATP-binding protein n=1 Tax=Desulfosporosinus sp. TaxID=157907 RepID=UPI000E8C76FD|nr:ABC transporter ATP-binding protein [Desulfosporosinus sp.]MBC2721441.1 ABC transporter ATP-binding protein [Desulfosporosinus sp.]MBC2727497.1 ABC transporter ATP-binding protein [Desulfosporosinus sp.]HBV87727.1 ABC transporter ATP-binding protein [Desulfosporosinus sp.]
MANFLEIKNISKFFTIGKGQVLALENIHFEMASGELICLLGPSGCGKTTLLRIIAGLEKQASGQILLHGKVITTTGPERGMIFQEPRLFPWLTLEENVGFGIKGRYEKKRLQRIVEELLEIVGLSNFAKAWPNQLSGGMAQRAAIARALAADPLILLLDEPFAALDAQTRTKLQTDFLNLWKSTHKTCIHVTHDIDEALILGQRIIVMESSPGRIREIISVPFPYPRCPDDPDFLALKKELRDSFISTM